MKTLREYIDQLDEINRRDFLKGAGAAAGLAATGGASAVIPNSGAPKLEDVKWIQYAVDLALLSKDNKQITVANQLSGEIKNYSKKYPDAKTVDGTKSLIEVMLTGRPTFLNNLKQSKPDTYDKYVNDLTKNQELILRKLQEINSKVEIEEASNDTVARVLELSNYK